MNLKVKISVLIVTAVLVVFRAPAPAQSGPGQPDRLQILLNPSFADGANERGHPKGWLPAMLPARSQNLEWGQEESDGRPILFIRQTAAAEGVFNHWAQSALAPTPGSAVTIEAELKTEGVTGMGAAVMLAFRDGRGREAGMVTNLAQVPPVYVRGDSDWTPVRLHGIVPGTAIRMDARVGLAPGSAGALLIRGVRLYHERGGPAGSPGGVRPPGDELNAEGVGAGAPAATPGPAATDTTALPESSDTSTSDNSDKSDSSDNSSTGAKSPPANSAQLLANPELREADANSAPAAWFCTILKNFTSGARSGLASDADGPYLYLSQNSASEGAFSNWAQRVDNPPAGAVLRMSAIVAVRDAKPGGLVKMEFLGANGNLIAAHTSEGVHDLSGNRGWQTVTLEGTVPEGCARVIVRVGLAPQPGSGTLYLRRATLDVTKP